MDRLYAIRPILLVALAALVLPSCEKNGAEKPEARPTSSRVNAVQAKQEEKRAPKPAEFCDVYYEPSEAPDFAFPRLDSAAPELQADGWRWVNIWATWCDPCIEEMPRLVAWTNKLDPIAGLVLISADDRRQLVTEFRKEHPDTPTSLRFQNPDTLPSWLSDFGMMGGSLPVHIFVDPDGKTRCLRASGVSEEEYDAVAELVGAGEQ